MPKVYLKRDNALIIFKLFEINFGTLQRLKPKEDFWLIVLDLAAL